MQHAAAFGKAVADPDIAARLLAQHVREVFRAHRGRRIGTDVGGTDHVDQHIAAQRSFRLGVQRRRIAAPVIQRRLHAMRGGDAGAKIFHRRFDGILDFRLERAHRAADAGFGRDDVVGLAAGEELRDRHHRRFERVEPAADHALQRLHQCGARQQRIAALMRHRGVGSVAAQQDVELIGAGHHRAVMHRELSGRQPRPVVHAEHGRDRKLLEQTLLDHHSRAAIGFLGGLENEHDRAIEIGMRRQMLRRAEQHRGVAVVAAGMHAAVVAGAMRKQVLLAHRQCVHVRPQADGARAVAAFEDADHTGAGKAAMYADALRRKKLGNPVAGALFLKRQFRMRVQIVAQGDQFIAAGGNFGQGAHNSPQTIPGMTCLVIATAMM